MAGPPCPALQVAIVRPTAVSAEWLLWGTKSSGEGRAHWLIVLGAEQPQLGVTGGSSDINPIPTPWLSLLDLEQPLQQHLSSVEPPVSAGPFIRGP